MRLPIKTSSLPQTPRPPNRHAAPPGGGFPDWTGLSAPRPTQPGAPSSGGPVKDRAATAAGGQRSLTGPPEDTPSHKTAPRAVVSAEWVTHPKGGPDSSKERATPARGGRGPVPAKGWNGEKPAPRKARLTQETHPGRRLTPQRAFKDIKQFQGVKQMSP